MTIIGDAFVALRPEASGFAAETEGVLSKSLGGIALAGGVAAAGVAIAGTLVKIGSSFEDTFSTIQRETGATGATLKGLEGDVRTVFASTPTSLKDTAAALDEVYRRFGLTGSALTAFTTQEVDLARITKTDVATTTDQTTLLLNKMGVAAKDRSADLDILFKAAQASGKGIDTLATDLTKVGVPFESLGFSFGQTVALTAQFEAAGLKTQSAAFGLAKVFKDAAKAGEDPVKFFNQLILQMRSAKNDTDAAAIAMQYFSGRAGFDLARAARLGTFDVSKLFAQITSGKDGIVATANQTETLGERFKTFKNSAINALEPVGMKLIDWATKELPHVQNAFTDVQFAVTVGAHAIDEGMQHHIDRSNGWTTALSNVGAGIKGIQEGWAGLKPPPNAPAIEDFFAFLAREIHQEIIPGLKLTASAMAEVFSGNLPGFKDALEKASHSVLLTGLENFVATNFFGTGPKGGVLSPATAEVRLHAFEAAHGLPVGGILGAQGRELGPTANLDKVLGETSPTVNYLKAIHDQLVAIARAQAVGGYVGVPPGTNAQGQQTVGQVAGRAQAAKLAHLS